MDWTTSWVGLPLKNPYSNVKTITECPSTIDCN